MSDLKICRYAKGTVIHYDFMQFWPKLTLPLRHNLVVNVGFPVAKCCQNTSAAAINIL